MQLFPLNLYSYSFYNAYSYFSILYSSILTIFYVLRPNYPHASFVFFKSYLRVLYLIEAEILAWWESLELGDQYILNFLHFSVVSYKVDGREFGIKGSIIIYFFFNYIIMTKVRIIHKLEYVRKIQSAHLWYFILNLIIFIINSKNILNNNYFYIN